MNRWHGTLVTESWQDKRRPRHQPLQVPALAQPQPALVASVREQAKAAGEMFRAAMRQEREAKNGNH